MVHFPGAQQQGRGQQQQRKRMHNWKVLDDEMKVQIFEPVQFPLSVPAHVDTRTTTVPDVSVDQLLPEHCEKRGKDRSRETRIQHRLNGDDFGGRSGPGDGAGVNTSEERVVRSVDGVLHANGGHLARIRFELRLDIGDELRRTDRPGCLRVQCSVED